MKEEYMEEEFIPYEQALELRHLGYNYENSFYWTNGHLGFYVENGDYNYTNDHWMFNANDGKNRHLLCVAPLYQQAFRWFREKYGYVGGIRKLSITGNNNILADFYKDEDNHFMIFGNTYEECELNALKHLIEITKNL